MFFEATGLSEDQVIGKLVQDVIPEPSLSIVLEKYKEAVRTKGSVLWEESSDYPTGTKYGLVSVSPVFDANDNCVQLVGTVYDNTDRRKAEEELKKQTERVALLRTTATDSNRATGFNQAVHTCLATVGKHTGWPVGHAYILSEEDDGVLVSSHIWHLGDPKKVLCVC